MSSLPDHHHSLKRPSLRKLVLLETGQDVYRCQNCALCNERSIQNTNGEMDIPLNSLVQMIIWNDEEVLTSQTVWSDTVFQTLRYTCSRGLKLDSVIMVLRNEARLRGLTTERRKNENRHYW